MNSELPSGWISFSLSDIGGLSGGKTPSKAVSEFWGSPDVPWVSPKDMKKNLLDDSADKISHVAVKEAGMVLYPPGSVLMVTRSGILQHTFPVALACAALTVNQDVKVLRPVEGVQPKFAFFMLKNFATEILSICSKDGTTVQSIDSEKLENFKFPLPPSAEQVRVAQRLEELLSQVDTLKSRIDAIPALLKRFRQSVLASAVSGRLTERWRAQNAGWVDEGNPAAMSDQDGECRVLEDQSNLRAEVQLLDDVVSRCGWGMSPINTLVTGLEQGWSPKCGAESVGEMDDSWAVIKTTAIQSINFYSLENKKLPKSLAPRPDLAIQSGDVLITRAGPRSRAAICCYVKKTKPNLMVCDKAYRFRVIDEKFSGLLVCYFLNSPQYLRILDGLKTGISESGVNLTMRKFQEIELPTPPIDEQTEIVRQVEQLFAFADQLESKVQAAKARIDLLSQSILAKAFRGELVPQDSSDEPASVLLERIRAQRAAQPKARRGRKAGATN